MRIRKRDLLPFVAALAATIALGFGFDRGASRAGEAAARQAPDGPRLVGRAVLPADTFAAGPPAGAALSGPINGRTPPFPSQPVQGFSALLAAGPGDLWAMSDNGFGAKDNSADFLLRVYRIDPDFETGRRNGGDTIEVESFVGLRDPCAEIPFPIVNSDRPGRLLSGADFDIESMRRDRSGTLWFGDEFGPFLLHTDRRGRVLEAPIPLPGVRSPQSPDLERGEAPNLPASRGFEGMAITPDGRRLLPLLEGALTTDPDQRRRLLYEFDIRARKYTDRRWQYRTEDAGHAIGDLTALDRHRLLVIERDNLQGTAARFKRVYLVDQRSSDGAGVLRKRELVDLLEIRDPHGISPPARPGDVGIGHPFSFPFQTIESVLPLPGRRLLILNDNNYPFSAGRNPGVPDDTEAIVVHIPALAEKG